VLTWSEELHAKALEMATLDNLKSTASLSCPNLDDQLDLGRRKWLNIMPHIIERSVFYDGNGYNLAIDRMVKAYTGKDKSTLLPITIAFLPLEILNTAPRLWLQ